MADAELVLSQGNPINLVTSPFWRRHANRRVRFGLGDRKMEQLPELTRHTLKNTYVPRIGNKLKTLALNHIRERQGRFGIDIMVGAPTASRRPMMINNRRMAGLVRTTRSSTSSTYWWPVRAVSGSGG